MPNFEKNGNTARFVLKANSKYFIDYVTKCSPTDCLYDYHFIKDSGRYSYGNDIKITITTQNEDALPEYTVTKAYDFYLTREKNKIEVYSEKESHSKAFSVKFTPDLERLDSEADSIFALFICGSIALSAIVSFILIILCNRLNKKISNLEDNDNMSILLSWVKNKIGEVDEKALIKSVISLLVMSILLSILFYIVIKRISFPIAPNTIGVAIYFVVFIIINIFIYLFPIVKYMKYCELKLDYDIKRGEIIKCYSYSINTNQNDNAAKYKIDASITIDGELKKISSGYRKVDKLDPIEIVFVLYIDDKHYYVDYLKK